MKSYITKYAESLGAFQRPSRPRRGVMFQVRSGINEPEAEFDKAVALVIEADIRWIAKESAAYIEDSKDRTPDGSTHPLRFNKWPVFIEPLIRIAVPKGIKTELNPAWVSAQFEARVVPPAKPTKLGYHVVINHVPVSLDSTCDDLGFLSGLIFRPNPKSFAGYKIQLFKRL